MKSFCHCMIYIWRIQRWFHLDQSIYRNVFEPVGTFLVPFDTFVWPCLYLCIVCIFKLVIHLYHHTFHSILFLYVQVWQFCHYKYLLRWLRVVFGWLWLWPFVFYRQSRFCLLGLLQRTCSANLLGHLKDLLLIHTYHRFSSFQDPKVSHRLHSVLGIFWHHLFFCQDAVPSRVLYISFWFIKWKHFSWLQGHHNIFDCQLIVEVNHHLS